MSVDPGRFRGVYALIALGLILFLITFAVLAMARLMLRSQVRA